MIRADRIKEASAPLELQPYGAFPPARSTRAHLGNFLGDLLEIP